jgi:hypothetical protein
LAQLCVAGVADAPFSNGGTDAFEREFEAEIRLRCKNAEETIAKIDQRFADDSNKRFSAKRAVAAYWL